MESPDTEIYMNYYNTSVSYYPHYSTLLFELHTGADRKNAISASVLEKRAVHENLQRVSTALFTNTSVVPSKTLWFELK